MLVASTQEAQLEAEQPTASNQDIALSHLIDVVMCISIDVYRYIHTWDRSRKVQEIDIQRFFFHVTCQAKLKTSLLPFLLVSKHNLFPVLT